MDSFSESTVTLLLKALEEFTIQNLNSVFPNLLLSQKSLKENY